MGALVEFADEVVEQSFGNLDLLIVPSLPVLRYCQQVTGSSNPSVIFCKALSKFLTSISWDCASHFYKL